MSPFSRRIKDLGNYRSVNLTLVPGKIMKNVIRGVLEKHLRDNIVIGHSQQGFMTERSCLINLIAFRTKSPV